MPGPGTLLVCATPIGNLADCSPRLVEALRGVAAVACEDTRRTGRLLAALDVSTPLVSLHAHNEARRAPVLVARLLAGERLALVSDAGAPGISDPGAGLVAAAHAAGIRVEPIPGPSALATALAASGLPADRAVFVGFLPRAAAALDALVDEVDALGATVVAFEAPTRLPATLARLAARTPAREAVVCRELTKLHEEVARGSLAALATRFAAPPKGEVTLVLAPVEPVAARAPLDEAAVDEALAGLRAGGLGARDAARLVGRLAGLPANELYDRARRPPRGAGIG